MEQFVLILYEMMTVVIPFLVIVIVGNHRKRKQGMRVSRWRNVLLVIFAFYLFGVFYVTGAGTLYDGFRNGLKINWNQVNLLPFSDDTVNTYVFLSHGMLNVLLFLPFGFLLPLLWEGFERIGGTLLSGVLFSMGIELSQLLNHRISDIDDLVWNVCGSALGYVLYRLVFHSSKGVLSHQRGRKVDMFLFVAIPFLVRFFIFDEFGMAKLLYKF